MLGPFIMVDELIYSELAKSFAVGPPLLRPRHCRVRGYGAVYPILIAPAYAAFDRIPDAYAAVKTINSLVMSLAAIPAYLLARRVVGQWPRAARGGARGRGAVDGLHGHGDDRERVLPGLPARRARARRAARAARRCSAVRRLLRRARARVPDAVAGGRDRRCGGHGADPARRSGRRSAWRATLRSYRLALRHLRRWRTARSSPAQAARGQAAERRCSAPTRSSASRATTSARPCTSRLPRRRSSTSIVGVIPVRGRDRADRHGRARSTRPLQVLLAVTLVARSSGRSSSSGPSPRASPTGSRSATCSSSRRCS